MLHRLLVVDDDLIFRERLVRALNGRGLHCGDAATASQALERAAEAVWDGVLLDLRLPDRSGIDLILPLQTLQPAARIVVFTGYGSITTAVDAVRRGALDYLVKPIDVDQILAAFRQEPRPHAAAGEAAATVPSLSRVEWEHIQRVLHECGGNISQTARTLGMHRRSLQRKLAKHPPRS
jgi:two-component system response regulator RegA